MWKSAYVGVYQLLQDRNLNQAKQLHLISFPIYDLWSSLLFSAISYDLL